MLSVAKQTLEKEIHNILNKSMEEAFKSLYIHSSVEENINEVAKKQINDAAKKFAKTCADNASKPMAEAIYDFVKSIGITAIPKTLIAPPMGGTVTGVINMADFKIN